MQGNWASSHRRILSFQDISWRNRLKNIVPHIWNLGRMVNLSILPARMTMLTILLGNYQKGLARKTLTSLTLWECDVTTHASTACRKLHRQTKFVHATPIKETSYYLYKLLYDL